MLGQLGWTGSQPGAQTVNSAPTFPALFTVIFGQLGWKGFQPGYLCTEN